VELTREARLLFAGAPVIIVEALADGRDAVLDVTMMFGEVEVHAGDRRLHLRNARRLCETGVSSEASHSYAGLSRRMS
jgi:hypothetical protein